MIHGNSSSFMLEPMLQIVVQSRQNEGLLTPRTGYSCAGLCVVWRLMARSSKYSQETLEAICLRLREGTTRKVAALCAGISEDTFGRWLKRYADFADSVARAEADRAAQYASVINKAADGYKAGERRTTLRTVVEYRTIVQPDGTKISEPVTLELKTVETIERMEFDWQAAKFWLTHRNRDDWHTQPGTGGVGSASKLRFEANGALKISEIVVELPADDEESA